MRPRLARSAPAGVVEVVAAAAVVAAVVETAAIVATAGETGPGTNELGVFANTELRRPERR
jgi:hypothetical protein